VQTIETIEPENVQSVAQVTARVNPVVFVAKQGGDSLEVVVRPIRVRQASDYPHQHDQHRFKPCGAWVIGKQLRGHINTRNHGPKRGGLDRFGEPPI
jgi:hypothetical protein